MSLSGASPSADVMDPPIADCSGYLVTVDDLDFLAIPLAMAGRWQMRSAPLGMDTDQYAALASALVGALFKDGIDSCDIRVQGSSAAFFSGRHKAMPWTRSDIFDLFRVLRNRIPTAMELDRIEHALKSQWTSSFRRPTQRPFDVLLRLGIARLPSDIDLQVSSDEIEERATALLLERQVSPSALTSTIRL
jgi:hypothetical protein